jgi:RimJ/RimL family protein N-acetyltransferase
MYELVFDQKEAVGAWVAEQVDQRASWGDFYAMGAAVDGQFVAGIVFHEFNGCNAACHVAVAKPGKYLLDLLWHGAHYAFVACGLLRLTGFVESDNAKALALNKHMGFTHEFMMRRAGRAGQDVEVLVLWPENFRYWGDYGWQKLQGA